MISLPYGIPWPSALQDLDSVFIDYVKDKKFLDLGSADGKVVQFATAYTDKARGVEIVKQLYENSFVYHRITHGNMFNLDFSEEEVLYYYLKGSHHELELIQKLNKEFHGILIIYYGSMLEKQVDTFASFLNAGEVKTYPNVKVYQFQ